MGFFKEITSNVTHGIRDFTRDTFFEKNDEVVDNEPDLNKDSKKQKDTKESRHAFRRNDSDSNVKENKESYSSNKEITTKNMVKNEIDNIINSLEKMDETKNENNFKKQQVNDNETQQVQMKTAKKKTKPSSQENTTIIAKNTIIAGNIVSVGDMDIYGSVCGDVECQGRLVIAGELTGNAIANNICINTAKFEGDICCEGCIEIAVGTVVIGNLVGTSAVISGAVKGEIDIDGSVVLDSSAVVKGNIKAKSVQMDNGAVLQGYCELVYAEVNIDDIFKDEEDNYEKSEQKAQQKTEELPQTNAYLKEMENNYNAYMEELQKNKVQETANISLQENAVIETQPIQNLQPVQYTQEEQYVQPEQYAEPEQYVQSEQYIELEQYAQPEQYIEPEEQYVQPEQYIEPEQQYVQPEQYIEPEQYVQPEQYTEPEQKQEDDIKNVPDNTYIDSTNIQENIVETGYSHDEVTITNDVKDEDKADNVEFTVQQNDNDIDIDEIINSISNVSSENNSIDNDNIADKTNDQSLKNIEDAVQAIIDAADNVSVKQFNVNDALFKSSENLKSEDNKNNYKGYGLF